MTNPAGPEDVIEHRRAEETFRLIVEAAPIGMVVVNREGTILMVNAHMEKLFGYSRAQLVNQPIETLIPERFRGKHRGYQEAFSADPKSRFMGVGRDLYGLRQDGSEFPVEIGLNPVETPDDHMVMAFIIDITERKRAARKMQEQAALLDITADAIFVRDMRHEIIYWNRGAERLYGWSSVEAIGKNADDLLGTHAPDLMRAYEIVLEKGEWIGELQRKARNGHELKLRSRWTLVRDPQEDPRGILAVDTDVTEWRAIQSQLIRVQRLESVGTLAGGIAHDLNNILSPILMGVEALSLQHSDKSTIKILDIMKTAAQRGANIVGQVLSFARGGEGERAELQLKYIIHEIEKLITETFPKTIDIRSNISKDLLPVIADSTHMHQVLMNLCVNARDAMPEGGVLTISADNVKLDEDYARTHIEAQPICYVALKVEDTGTGMTPGIIDKIFDPFFTTKEPGKGTGLGLSTVHTIVKSHGGFMTVYSELGKGSAFNVYIPAFGQKEVEHGENVQEGLPMGEGELVLIVDDEAPVREITQQILESYGYRVLLANDGTEAVVRYVERREEIRVVLTDMMMPYMDGKATIRALRKIDPGVKIISTSGLARREQPKEAVDLGVNAFLTKPYTAETLLRTLREVLSTTTSEPGK